MSKPTPRKNWATFLIAVGGVLIALSPMTTGKYYNIITGLLLIGLGIYRLRK